jgi:hypothetical protein
MKQGESKYFKNLHLDNLDIFCVIISQGYSWLLTEWWPSIYASFFEKFPCPVNQTVCQGQRGGRRVEVPKENAPKWVAASVQVSDKKRGWRGSGGAALKLNIFVKRVYQIFYFQSLSLYLLLELVYFFLCWQKKKLFYLILNFSSFCHYLLTLEGQATESLWSN